MTLGYFVGHELAINITSSAIPLFQGKHRALKLQDDVSLFAQNDC